MNIIRKKKRGSAAPFASMADIAFLLLIFFMLSSISDMERDIPIQLPETNISEPYKGSTFTIWVTEKNGLNFDNKNNTLENLSEYAWNRLAVNPDIKALIIADKKVNFSRINSIMETLRSAELYNITLVSRQTDQSR